MRSGWKDGRALGPDFRVRLEQQRAHVSVISAGVECLKSVPVSVCQWPPEDTLLNLHAALKWPRSVENERNIYYHPFHVNRY